MSTRIADRWAVSADDVECDLAVTDDTLQMVLHHTGTDQVFDVDLSPDDALTLAIQLTTYARLVRAR